MKRKKRIKIITCPCCEFPRGKDELQIVSSLFPYNGFMGAVGQSYLNSFMYIVASHRSLIQWACDNCINKGKAILANPKKQYYTFHHPMDTAMPFLAYYDKPFTCETCKSETFFSKEEQLNWYEKFSFIVHSEPKSCRRCRKKIRKKNNLNTELSELLKDGIPKEKDRLLRISEIYKEMGKVDKMRWYLKAAGKK